MSYLERWEAIQVQVKRGTELLHEAREQAQEYPSKANYTTAIRAYSTLLLALDTECICWLEYEEFVGRLKV